MSVRAERFQDILNSLADGVYFVDVDRRITFWGRGAERITGYTEGEVLGFAVAHRLLAPLDAAGRDVCENGCPLAATLADGVPREMEVFIRHAGGQRVPVLMRDLALRNHKDKIVGAVETLIDHPVILAGHKSGPASSRRCAILSPGSAAAASSRAVSRRASRSCNGTAYPRPWCCATSMASRSSTERTARRWATRCWRWWRRPCNATCAAPTRWGAGTASSFWPCSSTWTVRAPPRPIAAYIVELDL